MEDKIKKLEGYNSDGIITLNQHIIEKRYLVLDLWKRNTHNGKVSYDQILLQINNLKILTIKDDQIFFDLNNRENVYNSMFQLEDKIMEVFKHYLAKLNKKGKFSLNSVIKTDNIEGAHTLVLNSKNDDYSVSFYNINKEKSNPSMLLNRDSLFNVIIEIMHIYFDMKEGMIIIDTRLRMVIESYIKPVRYVVSNPDCFIDDPNDNPINSPNHNPKHNHTHNPNYDQSHLTDLPHINQPHINQPHLNELHINHSFALSKPENISETVTSSSDDIIDEILGSNISHSNISHPNISNYNMTESDVNSVVIDSDNSDNSSKSNHIDRDNIDIDLDNDIDNDIDDDIDNENHVKNNGHMNPFNLLSESFVKSMDNSDSINEYIDDNTSDDIMDSIIDSNNDMNDIDDDINDDINDDDIIDEDLFDNLRYMQNTRQDIKTKKKGDNNESVIIIDKSDNDDCNETDEIISKLIKHREIKKHTK